MSNQPLAEEVETLPEGEDLDDPVEEVEVKSEDPGDPTFTSRVLTVDKFARRLLSRLKKNRDMVVVIDGPKGNGKSTLAYALAKAMDKERFTFERNFIFSASYKEIEERIYGLPRYTPLVIDEAIDILYRLDWASSLQNALIKLYTKSRKQNKLTIVCVPFFASLRTSFRQSLVDAWVHVDTRGHAVVFKPDQSPFVEDKWHLKDAQKMWLQKTAYKRTMSFKADDRRWLLRRVPTFAFETVFNAMPEEDEKQYLNFVQESEAKTREESGNPLEQGVAKRYRDIIKRFCVNLIEEHGWKQTQLSNVTGLALPTINVLCREAGLRPVDRKNKTIQEPPLDSELIPEPEPLP